MSFSFTSLVESFRRGVLNVWRDLEFAFENRSFEFNKASGIIVKQLSQLIIPKEEIFSKLKEVLSLGHMTQMNAAAFLCSLSIKHAHSGFNPVHFFNNFVKLYNATSLGEVAKIERVKRNSHEWSLLNEAYNSVSFIHNPKSEDDERKQRLEATKIRAWALDIQKTTGISFYETESLLQFYKEPDANDKKTLEKDGKLSLSALPRDEYFDLLRPLRKERWLGEPKLSDTQCGIILCLILHAREPRRNGDNYVTHPMAVANLVRQFAKPFLNIYTDKYEADIDKLVWMAMVAALLHDGGEKSHINLYQDLEDLLPKQIIEAIQCLHKKDGESYFDYLERCVSNPIAGAVKLCDLYHNSLDIDKPSPKQEYVYPISALYMEYRLKNPNSKVSVREFCIDQGICTSEQFEHISYFSGDGKKKNIEEARKVIGSINIVRTLKNIFLVEEINQHAYTRREENPTLFH